MEWIHLYRPVSSVDEDGNPTTSSLQLVSQFMALVAPQESNEQVSNRATSLASTYKLYVRAMPTGIQSTDILRVRGFNCQVIGMVASWRDVHGKHVGEVITARIISEEEQ